MHIYILGHNLLQWNLFKRTSLSYLYEAVRTNFCADIWIFRNF